MSTVAEQRFPGVLYVEDVVGPYEPTPCRRCGGTDRDGTTSRADYCSRDCKIAAEGRSPAPHKMLGADHPERIEVRPVNGFTEPETASAPQDEVALPEATITPEEELEPGSEIFPGVFLSGPRPPEGWPVGRRHFVQGGYINVMTEAGWVAEHRVVLEEVLGRPLRRGESVHHKNGIRHDNRPENLELWVGPIRKGVRGRDFRCPHCEEPWIYPDAPGA